MSKIFITYKYGDTHVQSLKRDDWPWTTTARTYVNEIQELLEKNNEIYKGENDDESLDEFADDTIASKLRNKIYDSSITIVIISKGMKEDYKSEKDQWIPWEISYSLKEHTRNNRTSLTNAVLAVVLPDEFSSYSYFITDNTCGDCTCRTLNTPTLFGILKDNMFNIKMPVYKDDCSNSLMSSIYLGYSSYIHSVKWSDFRNDIDYYLKIAIDINSKIQDYNITKIIK